MTFLFTDLVGSTQTLARLGEDAAEELRRAHFGLLRSVIVARAGEEVKNLGDGLMVAFASPVDALHAALDIQDAAAEHTRTHPDRPLAIRIGVHAGEPTRADGDYFGTPVVVAKRLCDRADGGQILAGELVTALVGTRDGFGFDPLGPLELKGLEGRVPAVAVRRAGHPAPAPATTAVAPPLPSRLALRAGEEFVGRVDDLDRLLGAHEQAAAGQRRLVLVAGEPGVGKTTLCARFAHAAHAAGALVLYGRSDPELGVPYQPFAEALGHLVASLGVEQVAALRARHGPDLAALVPALGDARGALRTEDPATARFLLFNAVTAMLSTGRPGTAVVVILDDLHWADPPTLALLRYLAAAAPAHLLVVATYRPEESGPDTAVGATLEQLRREEGVSDLDLPGLDPAAVATLVGDTALAGHLHTQTGGNPFYVHQMLRHLDEHQLLHAGPAGWAAAGLPNTVRSTVRRRVARLGPDTERLLGIGAVIGREFGIERPRGRRIRRGNPRAGGVDPRPRRPSGGRGGRWAVRVHPRGRAARPRPIRWVQPLSR